MQEVWCLNRQREAKKLTPEEIEKLPEFVKDTLELEMLAVADGMLYGLSLEHVLGDMFPLSEIKLIS